MYIIIKMKEIIRNFKKSPSIVYFSLENQAVTITMVALISFTLRFTLSVQNNEILEAFGNGFEFASIMSASSIAVLLFFKDAINNQLIKRISETGHTTVFGLGEFSTALLRNELDAGNNNYIIFEKNVLNDKIEHFRKAGMGVVKGNAFDTEHLKRLNFKTMDYAIIALGNDRLNIELATVIIDYYKEKNIETPIKLVVHIINQDLNALFHQNFIAPESDGKHQIDIKTFSFYEEAAESFFEHNFIDGESNTIIDSSDDYSIVVVGNGELALNIIYQAAKVAHLPNENKLHIHLVDKNATVFKEKVIKRYSGINDVVELHAYNMNEDTLDYYDEEQNDVWVKDNLTHVIVCYDDEERNIAITIDLFNKTYLAKAIDKTLETRISFAIFNAYNMSAKIDADKESFKQFYSFGDVTNICTRENLLDEKHDLIAKLVHNAYADTYNPTDLLDLNDTTVLEKIHNKWYDASRLSDKLSSKAQSKHMLMKLKALGLQAVLSEKPAKELLIHNREMFDRVLQVDRESLGLSDEFLQTYSEELPKLWGDKSSIVIQYFPTAYTTMLEKLIRAEHNRWNAFHYLNGWVYDPIKSKPKKEHDCLKPLADFKAPELQLTVLYDMYAILYIPNYLANAGYELEVYDVV